MNFAACMPKFLCIVSCFTGSTFLSSISLADDCDYIGRHNRLDLKPYGVIVQPGQNGLSALFVRVQNTGDKPVASQRSFTVAIDGRTYWASYNTFELHPGQDGLLYLTSFTDHELPYQDCQRVKVVFDPRKNEQFGCQVFANDSVHTSVVFADDIFNPETLHCDLWKVPDVGPLFPITRL